MMPVFKRINRLDGELNLEKLAEHINAMQEEIEKCFFDLPDNTTNYTLDSRSGESKGDE